MEIKPFPYDFSVCKAADYSLVNWSAPFVFPGKTEEEYSLVCLTRDVPANVTDREDGWRAFRIQGMLDFSLVGILAKISGILARNGISIFALSTYNTDYVLVKQDQFDLAMSLLKDEGYHISE